MTDVVNPARPSIGERRRPQSFPVMEGGKHEIAHGEPCPFRIPGGDLFKHARIIADRIGKLRTGWRGQMRLAQPSAEAIIGPSAKKASLPVACATV